MLRLLGEAAWFSPSTLSCTQRHECDGGEDRPCKEVYAKDGRREGCDRPSDDVK